MTRLEAHDIHVSSSAAHLVRGVSIIVEAASPLTIIGETGSGKSLLAEAIMGTLPHELSARGNILIDSEAHDAAEPMTRRRLWGRHIAMLPQEPWLALDPTMRADAQVNEVHRLVHRRTSADATARSSNILNRLGLGDAGIKYPHMLSGGMAQRVVFAATRAGEAPILIVDEPTKGLDANLRAGLVELLQAARADGCALLTITHDLFVARALGGRLAVMLDGEIIEQGATADILSAPQHTYTRMLVAAEPANWQAFKAPSTGGALLTARNIAKAYGERELSAALDIDVARGERIAIVGGSGSGKSTLGNVLLGLTKTDTGTVARADAIAPHRFQKIYQDPPAAFAPRVTMRQALSDLLTLHDLRWPDVDRVMQRLSLGAHLLDRRPDQISGGELQRFALLRVLLLDPVLILADEPTSRLDPITQFETMALLTEIASERNIALLLITHDPDIAAKVATRSVVLGC